MSSRRVVPLPLLMYLTSRHPAEQAAVGADGGQDCRRRRLPVSSLPAPSGRRVTCNRSESSAEGLDDGIIGVGGTSDYDIMLEFDGPFRWVTPGAEPSVIEPRSAPQLWARPTGNAGFVTLHWVRTKQCSHEESLEALPVDYVRHVTHDFCQFSNGNLPEEVRETVVVADLAAAARGAQSRQTTLH